jgi:HPt (histidine-containing phosphotransfer) domain-containing protein
MPGRPGSSAALDLDLLARQTLGDRALEADLLDLFELQATRLWPIIAGLGDRQDRANAAHTLKGGAAAVGARDVLHLAGELESNFSDGSAEPAGLVAALDIALRETSCAIAVWRRAASGGPGLCKDGFSGTRGVLKSA